VQASGSAQEFTFNISIKQDAPEKFLAQERPPVALLDFKHSAKDLLDLTDEVIKDNLAQI
jgi:hypothetical protein